MRPEEAITLGVALAEAEALWKLRMKKMRRTTPTAADYALFHGFLQQALARQERASALRALGVTPVEETINLDEMLLTPSEHAAIRDDLDQALARAAGTPRDP